MAMLKKLGYRADVAANGSEALEALSRIPYTLVLMDCQMPELDGFEVTRQIRNEASAVLNHQVTIIAMTANAMAEDRERCIKAGMDDYLPKPVKPQELEQMLDRWVSEQRTGQTPASEAAPALSEQSVPDRLPVFEKNELLERLGDSQELVEEVIELASHDLPLRLEQLQQALVLADRPAINHAAHTIRGIAANLSALQLRHSAMLLEQQADSATLPLLQQMTHAIEAQIGTLLERLQLQTKNGQNR
jgi:CheY-like chemotaxis protein